MITEADSTKPIEEIQDEEFDKALNLLLESTKDTPRTISLKLGSVSIKVFRNLPSDIEQKIFDYRKSILALGPDYEPATIKEAKGPLFMILSAMCVEKPYNLPEFWELYDLQSNGDASNVLESFSSQIKRIKSR